VVTGGRNDVSDDANTLTTAAKDLFSTLKAKLPHAQLIAVAPFWGDSDHPSDLGKVDDAVKAGVEAAGGKYLAIADPMHNHGDWMADDANPGEKGNKAIAEALKAQLAKLL
jgi:lysophospholipase L1-like esterase